MHFELANNPLWLFGVARHRLHSYMSMKGLSPNEKCAHRAFWISSWMPFTENALSLHPVISRVCVSTVTYEFP